MPQNEKKSTIVNSPYFNLIDIGRMNPRATLPNQGFRVVRDLDRQEQLPDVDVVAMR